MPFKSQAQEKYLYSQRPDIAARWQRENPNQNFSNLPAKSTSAWASAKKFAGGGAVPDPEYMTMDDGRAPMSMGQPDVVQPPAATEQPVGTSTPEQAPQQPGGMDVDLIRNQLQAYLSQQKKSQDAMQQLADLHQKQMEEKAGRPNLNALAQLADTYYGTKIADAIPKNPTSDQVSEEALKNKAEVMKTGQPIAQDLIKEYAAANSPLMKMAAATNKENATLDKDQETLTKNLNPLSSVYGSGNNNLGSKLSRARSVTALFRQFPDFDVDKRQSMEVAAGVASLITNQNRVPFEMISHIMPKNWGSDVAGFAEYMTQEPQSADVQAFMKRLYGTVQKEEGTAAEQIKAIQEQQAAGHTHLASKRPDVYQKILKSGQNYINMPGLDNLPGEQVEGRQTQGATTPNQAASTNDTIVPKYDPKTEKVQSATVNGIKHYRVVPIGR